VRKEYGKWLTNLRRVDDAGRIDLYEEHGNLVGPPQAFGKFSQEELERMGVVGLYKPKEDGE